MNYVKHYNILIDRSPKVKPKNGYYEKHRIIPGCMGGDYSNSNVVWLTAAEHFVAHQLLYKIYKHPKLLYAINMMTMHNSKNRNNNKRYSWYKKEFSEYHPNKTKEGRFVLSKAMYKYFSSDEYKLIREDRKKKYIEERICLCGCGTKFTAYKKDKKKYFHSSHVPKNYKKVSVSLKKTLGEMTKEEMSTRIKNSFGNSDPIERGKNISSSKKGKKTNQQQIMGQRYAKMNDSEFELFLQTIKPRVKNRVINLRNKYKK